jgi:BlaI family transcriptional regulator, penicillinase repressor
MLKNKISPPTPSELILLKVLWDAGPCTAREVLDILQAENSSQNPSTYASVICLLRIMHTKGQVTCWKEGNRNIYQPKLKRQQVLREVFGGMIDQAFTGLPRKLLHHFINDDPLETADLDQMEAFIRKARNNG